MKFKSLAISAIAICLAVTPATASAHEHFRGPGLVIGLVAGAAAVTAAVLTLPINAVAAVATPAPVYAAPAPVAYAPQPYYATPVYYSPAPAYYAPRYYYAR